VEYVINIKLKILIVSLLAFNTACTSASNSASEYDNIKNQIKEGRSKNAMTAIDNLLEKNKTDKRALLLKGYLLHSTEKLDQAQQVYEMLLQLDPSMPETYNNLGVLLAEKGDKEQATKILISAFDTNPAYAAVYNNLRGIFNEIAANTYREILKGEDTSSVESTLQLTLLSDTKSFVAEAPAVEKPTRVDLNQPDLNEPTTATPQLASTVILDTQHEIDTKKIIDLITSWSLAWSSQNPDRYLSYYQDSVQIQPNMSRTTWEKNRRSRIIAPKYIQVTASGIAVNLADTESATASFKQTYRASNYQDIVFKKMTFTRSGEGWKILQEQTL
jgi:tetratricopeptide (TPR) repeat protein